MRRPLLLCVGLAAVLAGCSGSPAAPPTGSGTSGPGPAPTSSAPADPFALHPVPVTVPAGMNAAPFDHPRELSVPAGWKVQVYSRVEGARFMAITPDGDLLVSQPAAGKVLLVREDAGGSGQTSQFLGGLRQPQGLAFAVIGGATWLYVAQSNQVRRYPWRTGDLTARPGSTVVSGLPDVTDPKLHDGYLHGMKNIAIGPDNRLYVSVGSSCNACGTDDGRTRAVIYRYPPTGGRGELFASGLRRAEGLAFAPGSGNLWAVLGSRDDVQYPVHHDLTGDGKDDYGTVVSGYVDFHPPEGLLKVRRGGFYGWPWCNPDPDVTLGMQDMPYLPDVQNNPDGRRYDCGRATPIDLGIAAHSGPLGLTFLQRADVPGFLRQGALVALHGYWNATFRSGFKLTWFGFDQTTGRPSAEHDLVTGFLTEQLNTSPVWGRPTDSVIDKDGSILLSDDWAGAVYRISPPA